MQATVRAIKHTTTVRDRPGKRSVTFDPPIRLGSQGGKVWIVPMPDDTVVPLIMHYWRKR